MDSTRTENQFDPHPIIYRWCKEFDPTSMTHDSGFSAASFRRFYPSTGQVHQLIRSFSPPEQASNMPRAYAERFLAGRNFFQEKISVFNSLSTKRRPFARSPPDQP